MQIERQTESPDVPEEEIVRVRRSIVQRLARNGTKNILSSYTYQQRETDVEKNSGSNTEVDTIEQKEESKSVLLTPFVHIYTS